MQVELVRRAQGGDRDAFDRIATELYDRLVAVAARILRDAGLGEDAVQDALVLAWRDLPHLRDADRFEAWVHRILVRVCSDAVRRSRRRPIAIDVPVDDLMAGSDDGSGELADRDQLERAFRRLSVDQRVVLVLRHYRGLSPTEIADTLAIPIGTVNSRLHYGSQILRAALEADLRTPAIQKPEHVR